MFKPKGAPPATKMVGKELTVGSFFLLVKDVIAEGAFGSVFRAQVQSTGRIMALKQIHICGDDAIRRVVARETKALEQFVRCRPASPLSSHLLHLDLLQSPPLECC